MASGKQVSFQFGEVSPALRFKSDAVSYSAGLSKLKNMYVRKAGGVSNRPGFVTVFEHPYQGEIPSKGSSPGIKGIFINDPVTKSLTAYECRKNNSGNYNIFAGFGGEMAPTADTFSFPHAITPTNVRFTPARDFTLITPHFNFSNIVGTKKLNLAIGSSLSTFLNFVGGPRSSVINAISVRMHMPSSGGPYLPASYYITAGYKDGTERYIRADATSPYNPATWVYNSPPPTGTIVYPVPGTSTAATLTLTINTELAQISSFNLYRASGVGQVYYKLAAKIPYNGADLVVNFGDYGGDEPSITPPQDAAFLDTTGYSINRSISGATCAAYYQQRLLVAFDPAVNTNVKAGEIGASKIGAPNQMEMPSIFRDTEAFRFSVPISDNTKIVAMLPMERLIVLTESAVYMIRGGEQGILTPTSVNPIQLSAVGCSATVEPKMKGKKAFFLNYDHTKLMALEFGDDANVKIYDASIFSDHLITSDIHAIEVISGVEDTVYLLKKDGTLIRITSAGLEDGIGFSTIETNGFIENIFSYRLPKLYNEYSPQNESDDTFNPKMEYLWAYIIRDGIRYIELLASREDGNPKGMVYADAAEGFGSKLSQKPDGSHRRKSSDPYENVKINIINGTTWQAGESIKIESTAAIAPVTTAPIDFFYDNDGVEESIRFTYASTSTPSTAGFTHAYIGTFNKEVPTLLRDVQAQSLTTFQKLKLQTKWNVTVNQITGLTRLANKQVAVFADGKVLSSPLNPNFTEVITVSAGGVVTLPDYYNYGFIGLPYESDFETLDLEASDNRTLTDSRKLLNSVGIALHETRGGFFGIENAELENMAPLSPTSYSPYNEHEETDNFNGHIAIPIPTNWSERGRVRVRQVDPLPMTILSVYPKGIAGD